MASVVSVQTIAPAIKRAAGSLPQRNVAGSQPFINVLCKFSDVAAEPKAPSYFDALMGTGPGAWASTSRRRRTGRSISAPTRTVGWFVLPQTKAYYVPGNTAPDDAALTRMATDCAALIPNTVDMTPYVGINFMFNDLLGGVAIGGTGTNLTFNGVTKSWSSTWMPPWGYYQPTRLYRRPDGPRARDGSCVRAAPFGRSHRRHLQECLGCDERHLYATARS